MAGAPLPESLLPAGGRRHAHTFIVRISQEPVEIATPHPRWRGEVQHVCEGEQVDRKRFAGVDELLKALGETLKRVVAKAEQPEPDDHAVSRSAAGRASLDPTRHSP
ncbi:MAG: hypothetical protein MI920_12345 [Kiloniellales bacterium]|nr:hypothetical protein [Kiloniellales bacterium]